MGQFKKMDGYRILNTYNITNVIFFFLQISPEYWIWHLQNKRSQNDLRIELTILFARFYFSHISQHQAKVLRCWWSNLHVFPLQQRTMSLTQSVWCSIEAIYGSCYNDRGQQQQNERRPLSRNSHCHVWQQSEIQYLMLVHAPYPDDWVSSGCEEPIERRVELESIHPISVVFLHLISNDVRYLKQ